MTLRPIDYNGHVPSPALMTEDQLYEQIEKYCAELGLAWHRVPDSRRALGHRGFPDYVIVGPFGTLLREVKDARNTLSTEQRAWGRLLMANGSNWGTWRPSDLFSGRILYELQELTAEYRAALR